MLHLQVKPRLLLWACRKREQLLDHIYLDQMVVPFVLWLSSGTSHHWFFFKLFFSLTQFEWGCLLLFLPHCSFILTYCFWLPVIQKHWLGRRKGGLWCSFFCNSYIVTAFAGLALTASKINSLALPHVRPMLDPFLAPWHVERPCPGWWESL